MAYFPNGVPPRALDANGNPAAGAKLYVYTAGTTTPATVYQEASLTTPHASPIVADANGVWPPMWASSGDYKLSATDANDATLPGFPIDNIEPILSNDDFNTALLQVQAGIGRYLDRDALAAATVPTGVNRVYLAFYDVDNHKGATLFSSGHYMRRISYADISAEMLLVTRAWVRSADRFLPTGGTNATNGGYWIIDEDCPTVAMFGAIADGVKDNSNVITGTDCSAAAQMWIDFHYARGGGTVRRNIGKMTWGYGKYRLSAGLDFTILSNPARIYEIDGCGATIYCDCADEIVFDMTDCEYFRMSNFLWYGSPDDTPLCAVKCGRFADANTAARWEIHHCSTRIDAASDSQWRVAALWHMLSEATYTSGNFWENYRDSADDSLAVGAAFDSTNALGWRTGFEINDITQDVPGVVTTATSHGYDNGDIVAFAGNCTMDELVGTRYKVANKTATTFELHDLDDNPVNTGTFTAYSLISTTQKQLVYKEKWSRGTSLSVHATGNILTSPSIKERASTASPNTRGSNKHNVHVKDTFSCEHGKAAIWQGAAEDNHFLGCFAVADTGLWLKFEDDVTGFASCTFQIHLERGAAGSVCNDFARFSRTDVGATGVAQTVCKVINCRFEECVLDCDNGMFRIDAGDEDVLFFGGHIVTGRFTADFNSGSKELFSSAARFKLYGTTVIIDQDVIAGTEVNNVNNFSGLQICTTPATVDITGTPGSIYKAIYRLPVFTIDEMIDSGAWTINPDRYKWGLVVVTAEAGGSTLAFADGSDWRRVQDRAVISA